MRRVTPGQRVHVRVSTVFNNSTVTSYRLTVDLQ